MVCKINSLHYCDIALIEEHINDRRGGRNYQIFADFKDEWHQAVQNYVQHNGNPEHVTPIGINNGPLKTALHNLWDHPNGCSKRLKKELQAHQLNYCPFCGEMGHPQTHDHYLPKSIFAEFSITHSNLVPMCDACQGLKKTDYLINGHKTFLHPYYDADDIIFNLSITGDFNPVPNFDLTYECNNDIRRTLETHIAQLQIKKRLFRHLSSIYMGIVMSIIKTYSNNENARNLIKNLLFLNKNSYESININHWDAILYRSLWNSEEWLDYMEVRCTQI